MRDLEKQYKFIKTSFSINDLPPNMSVNDYKEQLKELEEKIEERHGKDYLEYIKKQINKVDEYIIDGWADSDNNLI